ncbi:MAG: YqgE/AlgH family protein [Myxococcota bacterium]
MKRIAIGLAVLLGVLLGTTASFGRLAPESSVSSSPPTFARLPQEETPQAPQVGRPARLLIATRQVRGPFFARSVILLMQHDPGGALGVILNRPTSARITELQPEPPPPTSRLDLVYAGGPVDPRIVIFLVDAEEKPPEATMVLDGIYATANPEVLHQAIADEIPAQRFRAYAGYSGWGPGQLDAEIARGDWYLAPAAATAIFDKSPDDLWQRLVIEHEGIQVRRPTPRISASRRPEPPQAPDWTTFTPPLVRLGLVCGPQARNPRAR